MISLSVSGLSFSIGIKPILEDVTFSINDGDRLGIVGVNGSGKSTLLRLICGEYTPDCGEVFFARDKAVGLMEQDDAFKLARGEDGVTDDTVLGQMYAAFPSLIRDEARLSQLENELLTAPPERAAAISAEYDRVNTRFIDGGGLHYKSRCKSILVKLGFGEESHSRKINSLSGGQRTRLALARLLFREPDILILDEPTNHLDTDTMEWLEGVLSGYKKTLVVVSHDRYFLDRVTNRTLDVENRHAHLYRCSYTEFVRQKEEAREAMEKKYSVQQKEIARLEAYIEQQRRWNRERNIIAAESREKAIARMEKVERPEDAPKSIRFTFDESGESGNDVLSVKKLSMAFPNHTLFSDLSFEVKKREHVFIAGPNGCGKSTLLKILLGALPQTGGKFEFGYNVHIGYYDQENQNLDPDKTVLDELWDAYPDMTQKMLRGTLALFMFRGDDIEKKVAVLSGGERARLTLAKLILSKMNVLILDEPTNHLDIASREALENALAAFDGTIIAVSHDRYFARRLATRVIEIGGENRDIRGGWDEYSALRSGKAMPEQKKAEDAAKAGREQYLRKKEEAARLRREASHRKKVAEEIAALEVELSGICDELYGDAARDYKKAAELDDRRITIEDRLMQLYEEQESFSVADDFDGE